MTLLLLVISDTTINHTTTFSCAGRDCMNDNENNENDINSNVSSPERSCSVTTTITITNISSLRSKHYRSINKICNPKSTSRT